MEYASDGLPQRYYFVTGNESLMNSMRSKTFKSIEKLLEHDFHTIESLSAKDICDDGDISFLFMGEVSDFIQEWRDNHD